MSKLRYYFKPNSLTWWSGVLLIALGALQALEVQLVGLDVLSEVLAGLSGSSSSPAQMILFGLTAIGLGARKGETA